MAFAAAAAIAAAGASAYGAYETGQASRRAGAAAAQQGAIGRRQMQLSEDQQAASLAPTVNARGDVTEYVPGVGWVERPSDLTRTLMARSSAEEAQRLGVDMPRARMIRDAAFRAQGDERGLAGALLARTNQGTRNLADVEADAVRLGVARSVAEPTQARNAATIQALRQGTGGTGLNAANSAGTGMATRIALEEARSGAPRALADNESARLNDGLNRYGNMMGRGTADPGVQFTPNTLADTLTAATAKQRQTGAYGMAAAGHFNQPQNLPDTGTRFGQSALNVAGALDKLGQNQAIQKWFGGGTSTPTPMVQQPLQTTPELSDRMFAGSGRTW